VSSILEALRELETRQPPAAQSVAAPAEEPAARHRAIELVGIASIGLVVGVIGFILVFTTAGLVGKSAGDGDTSTSTAPDAAPAPAPPTWLERAEPPRARVDPQSRGGEAAPPERPRTSATSGSGRFAVVALEYSPNAPQRVLAVRFDDDTVVRLHERESARGLEVQLIQADSAYVKRGGEIFVLTAPR
jgi:hypothetical protein